MGMESSDQAGLGGHWRVLLGDMRTIGALRAASPEAGAAERLTDRALAAAAHNPDHGEAGRAAALAELSRRGVAAPPWRFAVPTFLQARALAHGRLYARWRPWPAARIAVLHAAAPEAFCDAHDRMLRRELGAYGHVVCLEPKPADIRSSASYRALAQSLGSRFGLALRGALSGPVRTLGASPAWRALTLRLLTDSADAIVVDLSSDAEASIAEVCAEAPPARCVFVAIWGKLDEAQSALTQAGLANACFHYAPDGEIQQRAAFRAAMLDAMRATHDVSA